MKRATINVLTVIEYTLIALPIAASLVWLYSAAMWLFFDITLPTLLWTSDLWAFITRFPEGWVVFWGWMIALVAGAALHEHIKPTAYDDAERVIGLRR